MRTVAGAVSLTVCLLLTGCQADGDDPDDPQSRGSSASSPTEAPAADGPLVDGEVFDVHAPQGWKVDQAFSTDFIDQLDNPAVSGEVMYVGEVRPEVRALDAVAADNFKRFATGGQARERAADTEIAGQPAYHFTATDPSGAGVEEFGVVYEGASVTFGVTLKGTPEERQAVVDSILASWTWQ
jgi:hypothetical protein